MEEKLKVTVAEKMQFESAQNAGKGFLEFKIVLGEHAPIPPSNLPSSARSVFQLEHLPPPPPPNIINLPTPMFMRFGWPCYKTVIQI